MAGWHDIKTDTLMRDFGKLYLKDGAHYSESERHINLMRMRQDLDKMITDSMLQSQQMPDQMDILQHVVHQNKMVVL